MAHIMGTVVWPANQVSDWDADAHIYLIYPNKHYRLYKPWFGIFHLQHLMLNRMHFFGRVL